MPPKGQEIYLTQIELDIMRVFVRNKIVYDAECVKILERLLLKLKGKFNEKKSSDNNSQ